MELEISETDVFGVSFTLTYNTNRPSINPLISITINYRGDGGLYIAGFHSRLAKNPQLANEIPATELKQYKGLGYACLCWLVQKILLLYGKDPHKEDVPITLLASGHIPDKSMTGLLIYYATMGFSIEAYQDNTQFQLDSSLFANLRDLPAPASQSENLSLEQFGQANAKNPIWTAIAEGPPEVVNYIFDIIKSVLNTYDVSMYSTSRTILNKCLQSTINSEKKVLLCETQKTRLSRINYIIPARNIDTIYERDSVPAKWRIFFEC